MNALDFFFERKLIRFENNEAPMNFQKLMNLQNLKKNVYISLTRASSYFLVDFIIVDSYCVYQGFRLNRDKKK